MFQGAPGGAKNGCKRQRRQSYQTGTQHFAPRNRSLRQCQFRDHHLRRFDTGFGPGLGGEAVDRRYKIGEETVANGRIAMAVFMLGGLLFVFVGSKDLFSAVAVSGTSSMFLAPVIFFSIFGGRRGRPCGAS
jgi:hypothetical protein